MLTRRTECAFSSSDSWVILSPIEQSIKRKIESVGKPLKDWNINIYRGVLTGCSEAFIISTEKRDEILLNCKTEDERKRTEELIRPSTNTLRVCFDFNEIISKEVLAHPDGMPFWIAFYVFTERKSLRD